MWFKNRRAKFRKKQRSLQKEQLQRMKDAGMESAQEEGKDEAQPIEAQAPPSPSDGRGPKCAPPCELNEEVNVTSPEQSGAESGAEDMTDREDESLSIKDETKEAGPPLTDDTSPSCKPISPKLGMNSYLCMIFLSQMLSNRLKKWHPE